MIFHPFRASGACPMLIRYPRPSTIAVLPIPGLPTNKALLSGVINARIISFISCSLPIAGSVINSLELKFSPYVSRMLNL